MPETTELAPRPVASPHSIRHAGGKIALAKLRDLALIPAIAAICVLGQLVNPVFLRYDNLINVLQTMSEIALLVLAQTIVLIVGKMDLSLESTFGLAPGIAAYLTVTGGQGLGLLPGVWAVPAALAVGLAIGAVNAVLIVRFGLNGFIVTLGMLIVLRGLLTGVSGGQTFFNLLPAMMYLGSATWFGVPASIWICLVLFAAGIVVLGFTTVGRSLYAVGGNLDAANCSTSSRTSSPSPASRPNGSAHSMEQSSSSPSCFPGSPADATGNSLSDPRAARSVNDRVRVGGPGTDGDLDTGAPGLARDQLQVVSDTSPTRHRRKPFRERIAKTFSRGHLRDHTEGRKPFRCSLSKSRRRCGTAQVGPQLLTVTTRVITVMKYVRSIKLRSKSRTRLGALPVAAWLRCRGFAVAGRHVRGCGWQYPERAALPVRPE